MNTLEQIKSELRKRILVLDGAMGTMIQQYNLCESDFRGERFLNHPVNLKGCNDVLNLVRPDIISEIHHQYLDAGADIIETNTFSSTSVSLADYQLEKLVYEINVEGAAIARKAVDNYSLQQPHRKCFVAGSIGPTGKTASMSPDVNRPEFRAVRYDDFLQAYTEQALGLIDGGVDAFLIETVFDTLNAKAALEACKEAMRQRNIILPIMISGTITDAGGRTLSGQTLDAFLASFSQSGVLSIGLNCSLGAEQMKPHLSDLSVKTSWAVSAHPNAGLPDHAGCYHESPIQMSSRIKKFAEEGLVNIVGGCCGTTPAHIREIAEAVRNIQPRTAPHKIPETVVSGLDALLISPDANFINIGERTNVAGSKKFARLIHEKKYEEALEIARDQVSNGAQIIDINFDDGLLDAEKEMQIFLDYIASDPDVARVPVMIDSSCWAVIEAGLKCVQGKAVVNSISLKEGEEVFLKRAGIIQKYGAAVVVMAFDEEGQAVTFEHKCRVAERAYKLLTDSGFPPQDIVFDLNVLTIATGMDEHNSYALNFIRAVEWVKTNLPYVKTSGGISNLSFAFRGNDALREAMHAVFLFHAIRAGLDMGIVNAGRLPVYDELDPELCVLLENVILSRLPDAANRLLAVASEIKAENKRDVSTALWRNDNVESRLKYSVIHGQTAYLEPDLREAQTQFEADISIIEGPLLDGMKQVGELFNSGKMFLPQVVRSARVMKQAVDMLNPAAGQQLNDCANRGKILLATVKGDVHDIGKNIVSVVLACNHFSIVDLGVMVSSSVIVKTAVEERVDAVGLSGLITPSLTEMIQVAKEMEEAGMKIPLLIGGATTSELHTALYIAPAYSGPVVHIRDASLAGNVVASLLNNETKENTLDKIRSSQKQLVKLHIERQSVKQYRSLSDARNRKLFPDFSYLKFCQPASGIQYITNQNIHELLAYFDWNAYFHEWKIKGIYSDLIKDPLSDARKLYDDTRKLLSEIVSDNLIEVQAAHGLFSAFSENDDVIVHTNAGEKRLCFLRNQEADRDVNPCLADFVSPKESGVKDYLGLFVVTARIAATDADLKRLNLFDDYHSLMLKILCNRFAEAMAEWVHRRLSADFSEEGYAIGIRPAPGYPACPDHSEKEKIFRIMDVDNHLETKLNESYMMDPASGICGYYFPNPEAAYIHVGRISRDQLENFAARKIMDPSKMEKLLSTHLNYQ